MKVTVHRVCKGIQSTVGIVEVNGDLFSWSLEDVQRAPGVKIHGKTAIPPGVYRLAIRSSPKLKREVVWITDVPNFEYCYFHSGNKAADTDGCILVAAKKLDADFIQGDSKKLESQLTQMVKDAIKNGEEAWCEVVALK